MRSPPRTTAPATSVQAAQAPPACSAAKPESVAQRFAPQLRGASGNDCSRAAIGAGVMAAVIGIGLQQRRCCRSSRRARWRRSGDGRCGAVAELGRADDELVAAVRRAARSLASEKCPPGGTVSIMPSAVPSPTSQSSDGGGSRPPPRSIASLTKRQALIETVAAINDIAFFGRRRDHRIARTHHVARAKFDRIHADAARQLVHRGFDGKVGLRQAVAAKCAGSARCWCRPTKASIFLLCAAIDGEAFAAGVIENAAGRDCRRRRYWRRRASASPSGGRRAARRP